MTTTYTIVMGHTLEGYMSKYGTQYDNGELWDFSYKMVFDGTIEPQDGMTYWLIDGRLYETEE